MTGDPDLAQDIAQDAFIRWYTNANPDLTDAQHKAFLYRTATRLVIDRYRREKRFERMTVEHEAGREPVHDLKIDLEEVLHRLSKKERTLLWLSYAENWTHEEIAGLLHLKKGSVKVLLFRARKKVLSMFKSES